MEMFSKILSLYHVGYVLLLSLKLEIYISFCFTLFVWWQLAFSSGTWGGQGVQSPPILARTMIFCLKVMEISNAFYRNNSFASPIVNCNEKSPELNLTTLWLLFQHTFCRNCVASKTHGKLSQECLQFACLRVWVSNPLSLLRRRQQWYNPLFGSHEALL